MYGEANYGPPFGQGQTPMPPANQQCPPPPFHFHFQQGSPAAPAPLNVVQQAIYAGPPPIGQQGPYLYQHGFFAPPPPAHQSSSVPFSGMPNTGQSYGHPTLPVHGSTWHNMQHSSTAGNRNFQWIHPPALVTPHAPPYPCMSQPAVPHGALPPSNNTTSGCAAQGPTWCRALCPAQPQAGLQRNPPPPPASNFVNPTSFGTSRHLTAGASLMASLTLLPAATMPTAPSPSTSLPKLNASSFPGHPDIDHRSNKLLWTEMRPSDVEMEDPLIRIFSADCGFLIAITNSKRPQSHGKLSLSQKKKKKKGCTTSETNDTSCEIPSLQPQLVRLSDQQALQPLREKITTITDLCPKSYVELSLSQKKKQKKKRKKKKKKGCKTPETNNKSCESPSIQPHLVQVTDQEVEMPRDLSFSVKNKKRNGKKSRKPHDCNNEVCDVSVGTSVIVEKHN